MVKRKIQAKSNVLTVTQWDTLMKIIVNKKWFISWKGLFIRDLTFLFIYFQWCSNFELAFTVDCKLKSNGLHSTRSIIFIEYHSGIRRWLFMRNNNSVEVWGIDTCKLDLQNSRSLLLHDIFCVLDIQYNLFLLYALFKFTYKLLFNDSFIVLLSEDFVVYSLSKVFFIMDDNLNPCYLDDESFISQVSVCYNLVCLPEIEWAKVN